MPIYEYQCGACGHQLEQFQKISEAPLKECPKCHKSALQKLISATSFQLKGTGWYATDFKDKGKPKPTEGNKPAEESSSKKEKTSTDKKSEETSSKSSSSSSSESKG